MNLGAVGRLPLGPETRIWYRAVDPQFLPTALQTTHTTRIFSRYSPGPLGQPPFELLYLAENRSSLCSRSRPCSARRRARVVWWRIPREAG